MKKKEVFNYIGFFFTLFLLTVPGICAEWDDGMEILVPAIEIDTSPRHQWPPSVSYNSTNGEFLVMWRTSGKLAEGCPGDECNMSWYEINGQRVSPHGTLLGERIVLSAPTSSSEVKFMPKSAYNEHRNEYGVVFNLGPGPGFEELQPMFSRLGNDGSILAGPSLLVSRDNNSHPSIIFNPVEREYLYMSNDQYTYSDSVDVSALTIDEDGNLTWGPVLVGSTQGDQYNPQGAWNFTDNTYLLSWEDFRDVSTVMENADQYGALIDATSKTMIVDLPILVDFGTPDEGDQKNEEVTYNPDDNEFLVSFGVDSQPSLEYWGGLVGRIMNADGTPKGDPFVMADEEKPQNSPSAIYVEDKQKYFVAWVDYRNDTILKPGMIFYLADDMDIYARWFEPDGQPAGPEIPIWVGEGKQANPEVAYDPVTKRFLIIFQDFNAPGDFEPPPPGPMQWMPDSKTNCMGVIYGAPSCLAEKIYGEYSVETELLRNFRDSVLSKTSEGQEIIRLYYQWSPAIVKAMEEDDGFKEDMKEMIDGILPVMRELVE